MHMFQSKMLALVLELACDYSAQLYIHLMDNLYIVYYIRPMLAILLIQNHNFAHCIVNVKTVYFPLLVVLWSKNKLKVTSEHVQINRQNG